MSSQEKEKSDKWYPGKYLKEKRKSISTGKDDELDTSSNSKSNSTHSNPSSPSINTSTSSTSSLSSSTTTTIPSNNYNYNNSSSSNTSINTSTTTTNATTPTLKQRQDSISSTTTTSSSYSTSTSTSSSLSQKPKEKEKEKKTGWYPGKAFGRKPPSWAVSNNSHTPLTRRSSLTPVGGSAPVQTVGNVLIKVLGAKYMSATRPNFEVWVGSQVETFHYISLDPSNGSTNEVFEGNFPVGDLTSDVFILVKEEYSVGGTDNFIGRIVIPLSAYVTPKGPKPPKLEWMAIYPIMDSENPMGLNRFGLPFLPGSAMTKTKHSLGFLAIEVQLLLTPGPVYTLYLQGEPPKKMLRTLADFAADHNDDDEVTHSQPKEIKKFNAEELIRTFLRIKKFLTTPPAALSPVLKFPEVFILIGLYGLLCFGADAHHIPLILFFVVLLNGFLSEKKNFTGRILWNSLIDSRKINSTTSSTSKSLTQDQLKSSEYLLQTLNEPLYDAQKELDRLVNKFEVLANIWNFSDLQVSILFYGVFLGFALFSSLVIYLFSIRPLLFIIGTIFLLLNSIREYFPELMTATLDDQNDARDNLMYNIKNNTTKFWMLLERVPSDVILEHRHISRTCIVEDEGIEMQDAASKKVM